MKLENNLLKQLTHWGLNDLTNICKQWFEIIFCEKFSIWIQISPKFVSMTSIYSKSALVQVIAWHSGAKPLPELMMNQFTESYKCRQASMS